MTTPVPGRRPLRAGLAVLVVGALVAAGFVLLRERGETATATVGADGVHLAIGEVRIEAPPGVAPEGTDLTARLVPPPDGPAGVTAAGPAVEIELSGGRQPDQPVTVTMPAAAGYTVRSVEDITGPEDVAPVGLSRTGPDAPTRTEPAVFDPVTGTVTITTTHLTSFWQGLLRVRDIAGEAVRQTVAGETPRPGCHGEPAVDSTGRELRLTPTPRPSVWVCVRGDLGDAVVELTNTTPAPWVMTAPGADLDPPDDRSGADAVLRTVGAVLTGGDPILPTRATASWRFPLDRLPGAIELRSDGGVYIISIFTALAGEVGDILDVDVLELLGRSDAALACLGDVLDASVSVSTLLGLVGCVDTLAEAVGVEFAGKLGAVASLMLAAAPLVVSGVAGGLNELRGPQLVRIDRGPATDGSVPAPTGPLSPGSAPVVFVVDTSDSMGETDSAGVVKLESAREALIQRINSDLTAASATGLWTYPGGGSCTPGGFQREVRAGPTSELSAQLRQLEPAGNTPTADALTAVRDDLRRAGYRAATLVLVSDGESNCGEPPCDVARSLRDSGFDLRVHAVGFDISPAGQTELACIATATGGDYLDSPDGAELRDLLQRVSRPQLDLQLDVPASAAAGVPVEITATLRVDGGAPADDVRLDVEAVGANGTLLPVLQPVVRLGNLAPGATHEQPWSLTVPTAAGPGPLRIVASARSTSTRPVVVERGLAVRDQLTAADVGPPLRPVLDGRGHLVIMGDSWSSGEGADRYEGSTDQPDNRCHRSPRTYGAGVFDDDRLILACSGATTEHIRGSQQTGDPGARTGLRPQLDQLRDVVEETAAVALTIGGNDVGFADVIIDCLVLNRDVACNPLSPQRLHRLATLEQRDLPRLYADIHAVVNTPDAVAARDGLVAPVVVLPYATPVNRLGGRGCGDISPAEADRLRDYADALNAAIDRAVRTARDRGANVHLAADVQDAFLPDHTLCAEQSHLVAIPPLALGRGVGEPILGARGEDPALQEIAHPTAAGYRAITGALVRWSQRPLPPVPPGPPHDVATWDADGEPTRIAAGTTRDLTRAQTVALAGTGFAPGGLVRLEIRSLPRALGTAHADTRGTVDVSGQLPGDLPVGTHRLVLVGPDLAGRPHEVTATLDVRAPIPWWSFGLPVLAVVALGGAGYLLGRPRDSPRRTRT